MNNPVESITIVEGTESAALGLVSRPKHVFSAVYPSREEADGVRLQLEERGIRAGQIRIISTAEVSSPVAMSSSRKSERAGGRSAGCA